MRSGSGARTTTQARTYGSPMPIMCIFHRYVRRGGWGMSAIIITVDQRRLEDAAELPAGLAQSILSASRAAAKLSETRWLLVHCPVSNRIRRDAWLVDDALNEAPERQEARIIRFTRAARPTDEVSPAESMSGGSARFGTSLESSPVIGLSGRAAGRLSRSTRAASPQASTDRPRQA
jgi:hypothetical protein